MGHWDPDLAEISQTAQEAQWLANYLVANEMLAPQVYVAGSGAAWHELTWAAGAGAAAPPAAKNLSARVRFSAFRRESAVVHSNPPALNILLNPLKQSFRG